MNIHIRVPSLLEQNKKLPESSYYLDVTNFLIENAEIKNKTRREARSKTLEEINEAFNYSIELFKKDKNEYTSNQKEWFLKKKIFLCDKRKKLQVKHLKIILDEAKKNNFFN